MSSRAEEGGNQPKRVLLVGGLKHGEYMNFPVEQMEWELVEANVLAGIGYSTNDPRYIGNVYKHDERLTKALGQPVFTHACLREPENGGRYPQLLRAETEAHAKYRKLYEDAEGQVKELRYKVGKLEEENGIVVDEREDFRYRLTRARQLLETLAHTANDLNRELNIEYVSAFEVPV